MGISLVLEHVYSNLTSDRTMSRAQGSQNPAPVIFDRRTSRVEERLPCPYRNNEITSYAKEFEGR